MNSYNYINWKTVPTETLDVSNESIPKRAMSISYAKKANNNNVSKVNSNKSSNNVEYNEENHVLNKQNAQIYNNIEVEGENLFNSVSRPLSEVSVNKKPDINKRFSTEEAKRLSVISMQQPNSNDDKNHSNTASISLDYPSPSNNLKTSASNNNLKSSSQNYLDCSGSERSFSSSSNTKDSENTVDPSAIRRQMSIKRRSVINSDVSRSTSNTAAEVDPSVQIPAVTAKNGNAFVPFINFTASPSTNNSNHNTPVSRRSSLLASGDVLSMKMGKLQRKSSASSTADQKLRLTKINDLRSVSSRCLESTPDNDDIIPFTNSTFYKIQTASNHSQSDLEMDPLDTRSISEKKKETQRKRENCESNSTEISRSNTNDMEYIIKSIAENTRDQLRRSTVISSNSQGSSNQYTDFANNGLKHDCNNDDIAPNLVGFSFVKGNEESPKKINLNEAGYSDEDFINDKQFNSTRKSKKHKKFDYDWVDLF